MGQRIGYQRVSTVDQNTDRQLDGVELDKVFTDKASGKDTNRPSLPVPSSTCVMATRSSSTRWTDSHATSKTCAGSFGNSPARASGSSSSKRPDLRRR